MTEAAPPHPIPPGEAAVLAKRPDFAIGNVTVRPSLRTITGPAGDAKGEPRVIQVLVALADARGAVLSRDDLLRLCWNGRIVGDDAINRAIAEVRRLGASAGADFEIETVPRIGYRIAGVEWSVKEPGRPPARPMMNRRTIVAGGVMAAAALVAGGAAIIHRRRDGELDDLIEQGRLLQASGDGAGDRRAEAVFRRVTERDPGRADAWGWLAAVIGDEARARDAAQHALLLDRKEPNARAVLVGQRRDLDAWPQWEDALLAILADAPDNALSLDILTLFYQGMGRCRDSWALNERMVRVEPFNPVPQYRRALKHWIFGRLGEADKVANQGMQLWPRNANVWNARMLLFAFTDRASAALALLNDAASRPANLSRQSADSWRAALTAIASRAPRDIAKAVEICTQAARLSPGLAANAIMAFSHLGEVDAAYRVANGLFESRGSVVQKPGKPGSRDVYSKTAWGRTQFLFIPATTAFRADPRFPELCRRLGHVDYWRQRGIWPDAFVRGALDPTRLA